MRSLKYFLTVAVVSVIAVALIVSLPSVAQSQQELDSTKADPQHHKVEFENDQVRVVRYIIAPGDTTAKHSHPALVNIPLTDGNLQLTGADGKSSEAHAKAGAAGWRGPTTHVAQNIGDKPVEGILVEPKTPHSSRPAGSADETTLPDTNVKVEFENDQVRVVSYHFEPGQKNGMHGHPDNVQIVLTDAKASVTTPDGKVTASEAKAGEVRWRPALQHSVQNTGDKPFDGILVEMKGTPATASK
jgi:quercetin dioxygenase-like cupin family protein